MESSAISTDIVNNEHYACLCAKVPGSSYDMHRVIKTLLCSHKALGVTFVIK